MSLPTNLQNGLSISDYGVITTPDFLPSNNNIDPVTDAITINNGTQNILQIINDRLGQNAISQFKFPLDLPKYNFTIIQHEGQKSIFENVAGFRQIGKVNAVYRLSLPTRLFDSHQTFFNEIAPLNVALDAAKIGYGIHKRAKLGAIQRTLDKIPSISKEEGKRLKSNAEKDLFERSDSVIDNINNSRGLIDTIGALAGIKVTNAKVVTLSSDMNFKSFALSWHFIPKSFQESIQIQKICYNLRKNMTPKSESKYNYVTVFPSVYTMFFQPNSKFLYKFKPCVLTSISVDYQPGGVPAFYKAHAPAAPGSPLAAQQQELNSQNSPPESVRLDTTWLELDYYTQQNYDNDHNKDEDLPSNDPYGLLKDSYTFTG